VFVMYGGFDENVNYNDTWEFNCATNQWSRITTLGDAPPPLNRVTMVYDIKQHLGIAVSSQTWAYDGNAKRWSALVTTNSPRSGYADSGVYDPIRQSVVRFGGFYGGEVLSETWELRGSAWQRMQLASMPPARGFHIMQYDAATGSIVLFGGQGGGARNDTWVWRWASPASNEQACPPANAAADVDTDGDGLDSDDDPDCWWRRTPQCPPGTSCR
jgi:hypothetical protein